MPRTFLPAALAAAVVLSACSSTRAPDAVVSRAESPAYRDGQFHFQLASGRYQCDHGETLRIERELRDQSNNRIQLDWRGSLYHLERDPSQSGLPRFEDSHSGLVWIDLPWKGLLLDGRSHKPLANDCRAA